MDRAPYLQIVAAGASLSAAGLILPGEGNISMRVDHQRCVITMRGTDTARLSARQLVTTHIAQGSACAEASSEVLVHCGLYGQYPAVHAVVHAHPPSVQRLAASNAVPDCSLLLESALFLPGVGWVGALPPGSPELAAAVVEAVGHWPAAMLYGHGAVTVGGSLAEAMRRMVLLERLALLSVERGAR